jgi:aspartate/glutamate racemase
MGEGMEKRLVLIHTVPPLIEVFTRLGTRLLKGVKLFHILDEPLLEQVRLLGSLQPEQLASLQAHIDAAQRIQASAVLVTCSTLSPALGQLHASIPLIKIDQAMLEEAVRRGKHIGILATNRTTLQPTRTSLLAEAEHQDKSITLTQVFVDGALPALLNGNADQHDQLVLEAIQQLAGNVDLVVLAQASTARVIEQMQTESIPVPILTSPHTALRRVSQVLFQEG